MKDQMYYPSIRFEDMTNLELKLFRALRALITTVGVSSIYCFFFKIFFSTHFSYYIYMCVYMYIYIYIFVSGFWRPLRPWRCWRCWRLWEFVENYFQTFGFIYFWDLRHAVIGGRTISACPGLTWDQDMQICFSQGLSHVCFSLYGSGMYCPIGMQYKYSQEHIGMAGQDISACPGLRWDQDMQIYPGQQFLHVLNIKK